MEWTGILPFLSVLIAIGGVLIEHFVVISKLQERIKEVEVKSDLFWRIVEEQIPKLIHSPHTPEIDALLEKMSVGGLNKKDASELKWRLKEEMIDVDTTKKIAIILLLARLDQIIGAK